MKSFFRAMIARAVRFYTQKQTARILRAEVAKHYPQLTARQIKRGEIPAGAAKAYQPTPRQVPTVDELIREAIRNHPQGNRA